MTRTEALPDVGLLDDAIDHVRGAAGGRLVLEYGDYLCPDSRAAYRAVHEAACGLGVGLRFAFRHFPVVLVHRHALAASRAAEAAARQGRFWDMTELLFDRQETFADQGPRSLAVELGLDLVAFDADRTSHAVLARVRRDMRLGWASAQVRATPTLVVDGVVHHGVCDTASLLEALKA